jgi:hypothetical protein
MLTCPIAWQALGAARHRIIAEVVPNDNHPFTMTVNPAVQSTKNFTPQVPLYL